MTTEIETYFEDGCGRCALFATAQCKVRTFTKELAALRGIILTCGLTEEVKWGVPCYTYKSANILTLAALKSSVNIGFFKGVLLQDEYKLLKKPGDNSQIGRSFSFTSTKEIGEIEAHIRAYIFEAIEIEKAGLKVPTKSVSEYEIPEEFQRKLDQFPRLKTAFDALTPGRQKAYLIHFSQAKQSKTIEARVDKWMEHILNGKGMMDN
jgi:uncharacterized protein YdeI (YjbR/CyaY-like superfamily)